MATSYSVVLCDRRILPYSMGLCSQVVLNLSLHHSAFRVLTQCATTWVPISFVFSETKTKKSMKVYNNSINPHIFQAYFTLWAGKAAQPSFQHLCYYTIIFPHNHSDMQRYLSTNEILFATQRKYCTYAKVRFQQWMCPNFLSPLLTAPPPPGSPIRDHIRPEIDWMCKTCGLPAYYRWCP